MSGLRDHLLRRAVGLGLALAMSTLAHANGPVARPATHATDVAAHKALIQARLQRHTEMKQLLTGAITYVPLIETVRQYQRQHTDNPEVIELPAKDGHALQVRADGIWVTSAGAEPRKAELADLSHAGITGVAELNRAMLEHGKRLLGDAAIPDANVAAQLERRAHTAGTFVAQLGGSTDLQALVVHHSQVIAPKDPVATLYLAGDPKGDHLHVVSGHLRVGTNTVRYVDLQRHGVETQFAFDALVAKRMLETAKVTGEPTDPAALAQARQRIKTEIAEVTALYQALAEPNSHPELSLIAQAHATMSPPAAGTERVIPLVTRQAERLEVRTINLGHPERFRQVGGGWGYRESVRAIAVIDATSPGGRRATPEDLHRFGVASKAEFDAAVGDALLQIAPEDLP